MPTSNIPITKQTIIVHEEIEQLSEPTAPYRYTTESPDQLAALDILQSVLLPGELLRLAQRLDQAKRSGANILVGIEFTRGHARKIVYHESEVLERE